MVSSSKADDLAANPGFAQKYAQYQLANQTPSQGQYQPETTYKQGQAITLNGETYVALKDPGTTIPGSEKPGDKNNVWVGQDNIWKLQGNDLVNALKDRAANDINTSPTDILNSPDKAMNYLNNFGNFQGRSALEHLKGQGNYDPLYDLPQTTASAGPGQISAQQVLLARAETVAGQATDLAKVIKGSTAYQEFIAQEQTYYQQHPLPSYTQGSSDVAPQMTPDEQAAAKTVGSLPLGTGAKTAFYATPAGQDLQNYYKKLDGYNGAKMVSLGATPQQVQIAQLAQQNQNSDIAKATLAIANGTQNSGRVFSSSSSSRRISAGARRAASSLGGVASRTVKAPSAVSRSVNAPSTHTASARKVSAPPASLQRIGLINAPRSKQVTPSHA